MIFFYMKNNKQQQSQSEIHNYLNISVNVIDELSSVDDVPVIDFDDLIVNDTDEPSFTGNDDGTYLRIKYKQEGLYEGDLKNGKPHGKGTFRYGNKVLIGTWKDGYPHGVLTQYAFEEDYPLHFFHGHATNPIILTGPNQNVIREYECEYKNGYLDGRIEKFDWKGKPIENGLIYSCKENELNGKCEVQYTNFGTHYHKIKTFKSGKLISDKFLINGNIKTFENNSRKINTSDSGKITYYKDHDFEHKGVGRNYNKLKSKLREELDYVDDNTYDFSSSDDDEEENTVTSDPIDQLIDTKIPEKIKVMPDDKFWFFKKLNIVPLLNNKRTDKLFFQTVVDEQEKKLATKIAREFYNKYKIELSPDFIVQFRKQYIKNYKKLKIGKKLCKKYNIKHALHDYIRDYFNINKPLDELSPTSLENINNFYKKLDFGK